MTRDEFEQWFAKGSEMTVEELHNWGLHAEPCDCGDAICKGWQMVHGLPPRLPALAPRKGFAGN